MAAERAVKASDWVAQEIDKLVGVIRRIGKTKPNGQVYVCFGQLFHTYQDISDTLVGIMMRAKKRKLIDYPGIKRRSNIISPSVYSTILGDILFQGIHSEVEIFIC